MSIKENFDKLYQAERELEPERRTARSRIARGITVLTSPTPWSKLALLPRNKLFAGDPEVVIPVIVKWCFRVPPTA